MLNNHKHLEDYLKYNKILVYVIIIFLAFLTACIILLSRQLNSQQSLLYQSMADEISLSRQNNDFTYGGGDYNGGNGSSDTTSSIGRGCWAYVNPVPIETSKCASGKPCCESPVRCTVGCNCPQDLGTVQCALSQSPFGPATCYWRECESKAVALCQACAQNNPTAAPQPTNPPPTVVQPTQLPCDEFIRQNARPERCITGGRNCITCPDDPTRKCTVYRDYIQQKDYFRVPYKCPDGRYNVNNPVKWYVGESFDDFINRTLAEMKKFCGCP